MPAAMYSAVRCCYELPIYSLQTTHPRGVFWSCTQRHKMINILFSPGQDRLVYLAEHEDKDGGRPPPLLIKLPFADQIGRTYIALQMLWTGRVAEGVQISKSGPCKVHLPLQRPALDMGPPSKSTVSVCLLLPMSMLEMAAKITAPASNSQTSAAHSGC